MPNNSNKPLTIETILPFEKRLQDCNFESGFVDFSRVVEVTTTTSANKFLTAVKKATDNGPVLESNTAEDFAFRLGIEIEAENLKVFEQISFPPTKLWTLKPEGSLRNNGWELISCPTPAEVVAPNLHTILQYFKVIGADPEFTWRSSIHVHVNCRAMPVEYFKNFVLLSMVCEDSLFTFASPTRRDVNIFCTPLSRANFYALSAFMSVPNDSKAALKSSLIQVIGSIKKYSALNFHRLADLGTLEFRHLRGTGDPSVILRWCQLIEALFSAACNIETEKLHNAIKELNTSSAYDAFLNMVFGEKLANLLFSPALQVRMSRNISVAKEILSAKEFTASVEVTPDSGILSFIQTETAKEKKDKLEKKSKAVKTLH